MKVLATLSRARERALDLTHTLRDTPALLMRITLAAVFIPSGYGKLLDLEKVTEFFIELHIPMPYFNAVLVSLTELAFGTLVLLGLCSRLASLPLLCTMVVAIITAQLSEVEGLTDLLGLSESAYAVMLITLAIVGPGRCSLDHLIHRVMSPDDQSPVQQANPQLSV
jgi:putative oxidoreductase